MDTLKKDWGGVYPAPITPMHEDQSLDYPTMERYFAWLGGRPGVAGLVVNGNAGEVTQLSRDERLEVIKIARAAAPRDVKVVTGLVADSTVETIEQMNAAARAGADAALVFPVRDWMTSREPGSAETYFARIAANTALPVFVFQYPHNRGNAAYSIETLLEIISNRNVVAIKEAIWEAGRYHDEYHALRQARPDLAILSGNDEHILATLAIGADGVLLGYASLIPDRIAELVAAMERGDLETGRRISARIEPLTRSIYKTVPFARRHSRIKVALQMLGIIPSAMVREPLLPLDEQEREQVAAALREVGLYDASGIAPEAVPAS